MNRKNIKRPESLLLDSSALDSSESLESVESQESSDNYNVAFKNSFSLKKTTNSTDPGKKPATNVRVLSVSSDSSLGTPTKSPVSPKYLEKINDKKFYEWSRIDVHNWIINLPDLNRISKSQEVARTFLDHNISGDILPYLNLQYLSDMDIKDLKVKLILKKNIETLLIQFTEKYAEDDVFDEMVMSSNMMSVPGTCNFSTSMYDNYSLSLTEKVLTNLSEQIMSTYPGDLSESDDSSNERESSLSPRTESSNEKLESELKKVVQNFQRLKEDITPIVKHYKNTKASASVNGNGQVSASQTPIDSNYFLGNALTPTSINGSPNINSPMRNNIVSPTNQNLYNKRNHVRDSLEDSINASISIQDDTHALKNKSSDRMLVNPFKEKKDHDKSPMELTDEESSHTISSSTSNGSVQPNQLHGRTLSSSSIKATALTINKNLLAGSPSPTVGGSAYQTAQSALQTSGTASTGTHPTLNHQQSSASLTTAPISSTMSNFSSPTTAQSQITQGGLGTSGVKSEPLKQLKAKYDDPCYKVLQKAMIKHKINNVDWRNYVLVICFGDKERILGPEEKPVKVFKELQDRGQHPSFMIRQLEGASPSTDSFEDEGNESSIY